MLHRRGSTPMTWRTSAGSRGHIAQTDRRCPYREQRPVTSRPGWWGVRSQASGFCGSTLGVSSTTRTVRSMASPYAGGLWPTQPHSAAGLDPNRAACARLPAGAGPRHAVHAPASRSSVPEMPFGVGLPAKVSAPYRPASNSVGSRITGRLLQQEHIRRANPSNGSGCRWTHPRLQLPDP